MATDTGFHVHEHAVVAMRTGHIGLDGAESQFCDLSGRALTAAQVERTLRVFETAGSIDLSNNEIDRLPTTIPVEISTLDVSFNFISDIHGIERLQQLQDINLGFNRLADISILEFCPRLVRVNLSGNRLINTKGLETLVLLEHLDISENLIEFSEALRPLSLNQNLTHLTLRGNPISARVDCRVFILDMIPSVLMVDNKKIRSAAKYKGNDGAAARTLSYSRLYDDKKQFIIRQQIRPRSATISRSTTPDESSSTYETVSDVMFQPQVPIPIQERARTRQQANATIPPPAPVGVLNASHNQLSEFCTPYVSLYERLSRANGITMSQQPKTIHASLSKQNSIAETTKRSAAAQGKPVTKLELTTQGFLSPSKSTMRGCATRHRGPLRSHLAPETKSRRPSLSSQAALPTLEAHESKQQNVLNVIQSLIQHKKKTLNTLARQSSSTPVAARPTSQMAPTGGNKVFPTFAKEMGSGASIAAIAPIVVLPEFELDVQELTVEDICSWIGAQGPNAVSTDMCARLQACGLSAGQLLLLMDQDQLLDELSVPADYRKFAHSLIQAGRQDLCRDFHVTLKGLPDAMDKAVYVLERFPLVVDPSGQATRFLKYQRGCVLMVGNPSDMTPNSLRERLVAALKLGTLLIINFDTLTTVELEQFFAPASFPREVLSRQSLFTPEVFGKLLRPEENDPSANDFLINDQFKLVVVCRNSPPPKTALAMCVLNVDFTIAESNHQDGETDQVATILGVSKEIRRNSTELVEAAFDGDMSTVIKCLEKNYDLESEDGHGHTALSEAAYQGNIDIVKHLLDRGADPNKCNDEKKSPLYRAAYNGHLPTIEILLLCGADPRIVTRQSDSAFDVAKSQEIRNLLSNWELSKTDSLLEERQRVINQKERITNHVERERFALMKIHEELRNLTTKGNLEELESRFRELADEAIETGQIPRACADIRDEKGATLLSIAVQHNCSDIVAFFLTKSSEMEKSAQSVSSSSSSSAQQELATRLKMLAKVLKANVNSRDSRGWTPVAVAVFHESKKCLRMLLDHGADPKLKNQYNKNAFDFAKDDIDAALNVVKSRAEIRQVLIDWENERRVPALTAPDKSAQDAPTTTSKEPIGRKRTKAKASGINGDTNPKKTSKSKSTSVPSKAPQKNTPTSKK